jgi:hypothetical protein
MEIMAKIFEKIFIFDKEPQKIGLSQFKEKQTQTTQVQPSLKNKNIKLSDLMRGEVVK